MNITAIAIEMYLSMSWHPGWNDLMRVPVSSVLVVGLKILSLARHVTHSSRQHKEGTWLKMKWLSGIGLSYRRWMAHISYCFPTAPRPDILSSREMTASQQNNVEFNKTAIQNDQFLPPLWFMFQYILKILICGNPIILQEREIAICSKYRRENTPSDYR